MHRLLETHVSYSKTDSKIPKDMRLSNLFCALAAMAIVISCSARGKEKSPEKLKFDDFEAVQPDGSVKKFSDYIGKGKYILVDFWASWCGPCLREIPYLKAAYEKYRGDNFDILGVAVSDKPEDTQRAIQRNKIPWTVILNAQSTPCELYQFNAIPQLMLFGPDGTLLKRDGLRGEEMDAALAEYLK